MASSPQTGSKAYSMALAVFYLYTTETLTTFDLLKCSPNGAVHPLWEVENSKFPSSRFNTTKCKSRYVPIQRCWIITFEWAQKPRFPILRL
jgi:hypothetical protein